MATKNQIVAQMQQSDIQLSSDSAHTLLHLDREIVTVNRYLNVVQTMGASQYNQEIVSKSQEGLVSGMFQETNSQGVTCIALVYGVNYAAGHSGVKNGNLRVGVGVMDIEGFSTIKKVNHLQKCVSRIKKVMAMNSDSICYDFKIKRKPAAIKK